MRGAFARYTTVPEDSTLALPDSLDLRVAALAEPTAIALHAADLADVGPDDRILITGGGPIGLIIASVLMAAGVGDITVSEPSGLRRERALAIGVARAVRPEDLAVPPIGALAGEPVDIAFECSGSARAGEQALATLDRAGTLVFVGTGAEPVPVNQNRMIIFELEALGTYNYSASGFQPAIDLLDSGALPVDLLLEPEDVPLVGVMDAMERMARGEIPGKVLVSPEVA